MNDEISKMQDSLKEEKLKEVICSGCHKPVRYQHKHTPLICPHCSDRYYSKPKDEYTLFYLQEEFLKDRKNETLTKMYTILKEYCKKLIIKSVKNKFYFVKEELEVKAHDATVIVIYYYLSKPEFKIENSFGGYLKIGPIKSVLYADKMEDDTDSLNILVDDENELEDFLINLSESSRRKMIVDFCEEDILDRSNTLTKELDKLIHKIQEKVNKQYSKFIVILMLIGIKNRFKKLPESFMMNFYEFSGEEVRMLVDKSMFVLYKYLKRAA